MSYPGFWSIRQFEESFPGFHSASPGQPRLAVWYGNTLRLHEPPSTSLASTASAFVAGEYVPGWREGSTYYNLAGSATTSSEPDLPVQFHELIPELAAHLGSMGVANSESVWAIVKIRQSHLVNQLDRLKRKNIESRSSTPYRGMPIGWLDF
jgi:hypothetical protein